MESPSGQEAMMAKILEIQDQLTLSIAAINANQARANETFARMDDRFAKMDQRFAYIEERLAILEQKMDALPDEIFRRQAGFTT